MKLSRKASLGFALFVGNPTIGKVSFCGEEIEPSKLPIVTEEVKCLAPLFHAKPLTEAEATKEQVVKFIHDAGIIHIAAQGDEEHGEVFLAPDRNSTGQASPLPKEESYIVTERHHGIIGLQRDFLAAGAPIRCGYLE